MHKWKYELRCLGSDRVDRTFAGEIEADDHAVARDVALNDAYLQLPDRNRLYTITRLLIERAP